MSLRKINHTHIITNSLVITSFIIIDKYFKNIAYLNRRFQGIRDEMSSGSYPSPMVPEGLAPAELKYRKQVALMSRSAQISLSIFSTIRLLWPYGFIWFFRLCKYYWTACRSLALFGDSDDVGYLKKKKPYNLAEIATESQSSLFVMILFNS